MFRIAKNAALAFALTGMVLSQPALAVRSSDSLPAPGVKVSSATTRVGSPVRKSEDIAGIPTIGLFITAALVLATALIISKDNNENNSPG